MGRDPDTGEETSMRVAYLTLDEVNQHLALDLADQHGVSLDVQARPEDLTERQYDAVLYDPDSFPPHERLANLAAVLACPSDRRVAVHGYAFSTEFLHVLRRCGAIVARRLEDVVFKRLVTAIQAARRQQTVA